MKLKRAIIHKYRSVKPGTTLEFSGGINILLGQNGTGKTNLLKLISMMARGNFHKLDREEFSIEYEMCVLGASINVIYSNNAVEVKDERYAEYLFMMHKSEYQPFCHITIDCGDGKILESEYGSDSNLRLGISIVEACYTEAIMPILREGSQEKRVSLMSAIGGAGRFDEALRYFDLLTDNFMKTDEEVPALEFHIVVPAEVAPFVASSTGFSIVAPSIRLAISRKLEDVPASGRATALKQLSFQSDELNSPSGEVSFLDAFTKIANVRGAEVGLRLSRFSDAVGSIGDPRGYQPAFAVFDAIFFNIKISDSLTVRHDALSYGQKRLLAFLYYLECCADVVVADELVNGMHHEWIEKCVDQIGDRQAFLTSQNPLLLDYLEFESPDDIRQRFILCDTSADQWVWRNMTETEAEELHQAYMVGIRGVGEILRMKGLW